MSDIAIRVENLGKRYRIGQPMKQQRPTVLQRVTSPFRYLASSLREPTPDEVLWALKNVSFEVKQGEVIGIIGRNGAGKSTLLKILSRITEPTEGQATIYGRIGALLEVGTGFHPELTGRENVYLNGTMLGMKRHEIASKFDEIVAFAGLEKFIDTQVKRYSSGMFVRLAFAVAAHLEPEILIVDEVLAVGDAEFQRRCLGKIESVSHAGRTVLFVSHNIASVLNLCQTVYWLDKGQIQYSGETETAVQKYLSAGMITAKIDLENHPHRRPDAQVAMVKARLFNKKNSTATFKTNDHFCVEVECIIPQKILPQLSLGVIVKNTVGTTMFGGNMRQYNLVGNNTKGHHRIRMIIEHLKLVPGNYTLSFFLGTGTYDLDVVENAVHFEVVWNEQINLTFPPPANWGHSYTPMQWEVD